MALHSKMILACLILAKARQFAKITCYTVFQSTGIITCIYKVLRIVCHFMDKILRMVFYLTDKCDNCRSFEK